MVGTNTEGKIMVINDAPLLKEFDEGYWAFERGIQVTEDGRVIDHTVNKYYAQPNSMMYREWERGFTQRYTENLDAIKSGRQTTVVERDGKYPRYLRRRTNRHAAKTNIVSSESDRKARYHSGVYPGSDKGVA